MQIRVERSSNFVEEKEGLGPFVTAAELLFEFRLQVRVSPDSRSRALQGVVKNGLSVGQLFLAGWDIEDERLKTIAHVARDFVRDLFVAADQVRTKCLIVLERPYPIHALYFARFFDHLR